MAYDRALASLPAASMGEVARENLFRLGIPAKKTAKFRIP